MALKCSSECYLDICYGCINICTHTHIFLCNCHFIVIHSFHSKFDYGNWGFRLHISFRSNYSSQKVFDIVRELVFITSIVNLPQYITYCWNFKGWEIIYEYGETIGQLLNLINLSFVFLSASRNSWDGKQRFSCLFLVIFKFNWCWVASLTTVRSAPVAHVVSLRWSDKTRAFDMLCSLTLFAHCESNEWLPPVTPAWQVLLSQRYLANIHL